MNQNHEEEFMEKTGERFSVFYQSTYSKLVSFLVKYTNDIWKAQDVAQDAFIQALLKINTYRPVSEGGAKVTTWLYSIAFHMCWQTKNKMKDFCQISIDTFSDKQLFSMRSKMTDIEDSAKDNDSAIILKAQTILNTITSLPNRYSKIKRALEMREVFKMPYKQIAKELNLNLSTVKSQIRKGRDLVRKKVALQFKFIDELS